MTSLGQVTAVIGAQWGDEGKGKVVDILAEHYDIIARACGGANAGHTIVVNGKKHVFHLLPSGCLHEGKTVVLGSGMVIHLPTLLQEISTLREMGIDIIDRLWIAGNAHILLDAHKEIDGMLEQQRTSAKGEGIGTTKRGIGPAYMDKAGRTGLRMEALLVSADTLKNEITSQAARLKKLYGTDMDTAEELVHINEAKKLLAARISDDAPMHLAANLAKGKRVLIEGAQGVLLDIDHGTYPYVTSSATTTAGALQGLGLAPKRLTACIGVAKAYCTRVGSGAFPTEAMQAAQERLRKRGGEYGATTGRPRRCGWLHLPDLARGATMNGFTHWNITKLDVLDEEETIPVGIGVDGKGAVQYEEMPGWQQPTVGITTFKDLPTNAQQYIQFIEEKTSVPASFIGTGSEREQMIMR